MVHGVQHRPPDRSRIVASLARQARVPAADVAQIYAEERERLASHASVTTFLDVFVVRNLQQRLSERSATATPTVPQDEAELAG